jgi:hypothetical protein
VKIVEIYVRNVKIVLGHHGRKVKMNLFENLKEFTSFLAFKRKIYSVSDPYNQSDTQPEH